MGPPPRPMHPSAPPGGGVDEGIPSSSRGREGPGGAGDLVGLEGGGGAEEGAGGREARRPLARALRLRVRHRLVHRWGGGGGAGAGEKRNGCIWVSGGSGTTKG